MAVAVLPYDPVADQVVLIEQFRTGALDDPSGAWTIEGVAGLVEEGEAIEEVARREVLEETGLVARRLDHVCRFRASPGTTTEVVDTYVAEVTAPEAEGLFGQSHEHEDIRTFALPAATAFAWYKEGRITVANTVVPLQHLMLHHERLRRAWATA